jgi:hypothetical protein
MSRTFIALFAQILLAGAALAQGAGGADPASFADATQKAVIQQYCEKDGRLMHCLGVDISKARARCADLVRSKWAFCRSTFMMTAPESIPLADARTYGDNLSDCLRNGAIVSAGKSAGTVGLCMTDSR